MFSGVGARREETGASCRLVYSNSNPGKGSGHARDNAIQITTIGVGESRRSGGVAIAYDQNDVKGLSLAPGSMVRVSGPERLTCPLHSPSDYESNIAYQLLEKKELESDRFAQHH